MKRLAPLLLVGCGSTAATHTSATVPHAAPTLIDGQPMTSAAELTAGATSVAHLAAPERGVPDASVEVPGTQLHAGGRYALGPSLALGGFYEVGLARTAEPTDAGAPRVLGGPVHGAGVSLDGALATKHRALKIGLMFELSAWRAPYVAYEPSAVVARGHAVVAGFGLGLVPSYDLGRVTVAAGLTARTHPTAVRDDGVGAGPFNWIVHAAAHVELTASLRAALLVYFPTTHDPAQYAPGAAVTLTLPIGAASP